MGQPQSPRKGKREAAIVPAKQGGDRFVLRTNICGPSGGKTLFFVHGFPDDDSVWNDQVSRLSQDGYRCVTCLLPNFGGVLDRRWGVSSREMVRLLKDTIDEIAPSGSPVTLVAHDWGCWYACCFESEYPSRVSELVLIDVAPVPFDGTVKNPRKVGNIIKPAYMVYLAYLFVLSCVPCFPQIIKRLLIRAMALPMMILFGVINAIFHPRGKRLSGPSRRTPPTFHQAYPYFYLVRMMALGYFKAMTSLAKGSKECLEGILHSGSSSAGAEKRGKPETAETAKRDTNAESGSAFSSLVQPLSRAAASDARPSTLPRCPILFTWGTQGLKALVSYHSEEFLRWIATDAPKHSTAVRFEEAGHWVHKDEPEKFHAALVEFLKQNGKYGVGKN